MTSQAVQRAWPLRTCTDDLGGGGCHRVKDERKGIEELCTHGHQQIPTSLEGKIVRGSVTVIENHLLFS